MNPQYKVFLSTETGGSGLNLQVADTLINFELPWNPAKKNQRIGRIDRIGQKSNKLTIFNFITRNSIETQIALGLLVKQSLFDGVLGADVRTNFVDFSTKGRSQFIQQLEEFISETERKEQEEKWAVESLQQEVLQESESEKPPVDEVDFSIDDSDQQEELEGVPDGNGANHSVQEKELETVMNSGLQFLSGLFKMATGKEMGIENQSIEVNKETGEVTIKFKLPIDK